MLGSDLGANRHLAAVAERDAERIAGQPFAGEMRKLGGEQRDRVRIGMRAARYLATWDGVPAKTAGAGSSHRHSGGREPISVRAKMCIIPVSAIRARSLSAAGATTPGPGRSPADMESLPSSPRDLRHRFASCCPPAARTEPPVAWARRPLGSNCGFGRRSSRATGSGTHSGDRSDRSGVRWREAHWLARPSAFVEHRLPATADERRARDGVRLAGALPSLGPFASCLQAFPSLSLGPARKEEG